ncbi:pentatricopeptide repeat-containing protein At1g08070, chloroplastic-like [Fagus crenata]
MDEITGRWQTLSLTEKEDLRLTLDSDDDEGDQQYGAWLRGEPERAGAWIRSEPVRGSKQGTKPADKSGAPSHGGEEGPPGRSSGNKERKGPQPPKESISQPNYFGPQIPKSQEGERSTFLAQLPGMDLHAQGKTCMDSGLTIEGLNESFRKEVNAKVDVGPTTSTIPKMWTQSTGSAWKRSGGKHKAVLHEVPIVTIIGSKRSNDTFMVDTAEWETNGKRVRSRLDRGLATSTWLDYFPMYTVSHFMGSISDHLALVVNTATCQGMKRRRKVVRRFEEKWATLPVCEDIIRNSWQQQTSRGSPMFLL